MSFATILVLLSLGALLPAPVTSQANEHSLPQLFLSPTVLNATEQICPPYEMRQTAQSEIGQDIRTLLRENIICPAARNQASPAASCSAISTSCPSGYYWVRSSNGSAVQVYCDLDRQCACSSNRGWARTAYLNMSDTSEECPSAWTLISTPRRTCGRQRTDAGCDSASFPSNGIEYSHVCGQVNGYQLLSPDGFDPSVNIDSPYVDGISVTHGTPGSRQHIWSFASGVGGHSIGDNCPCVGGRNPPSFVGQDYFCETGNDAETPWQSVGFSEDTLWDGQTCTTTYSCECTFNSPPWFCKQLPQATTDDIEVRICQNQATSDEDNPLELIELYIL